MRFTEEAIVKEIANGIYTQWKIRRPSLVQKLFNYTSSRHASGWNDYEFTVETDVSRLHISTYQSNITFCSIESKLTDDRLYIGESFDLEDETRESFKQEFASIWSEYASSLGIDSYDKQIVLSEENTIVREQLNV